MLTLTATPIPRTLQMAFSGVRELSVIETPPAGRLAIQTQVLRFDPNVIRQAIRRELTREGQIYYVHNRVQTMERTASWIQELVPDAHVVMAHGQMDGRVLEGVMLQFFHGEADILVASSIIQSGLDVPRANTMLVDRADLFGLAQLYQLRGRVGRAGEQAYAYFFFPNEELLSTDAQKRLLAIQEFADLGSGFRIAAADLEIRGAGNILGKQQSGNIVAVGLDLYMQMVEQAVQHIKGQEVEEELDPELHLNVSAFVPDNYVEDGHQRRAIQTQVLRFDPNVIRQAIRRELTREGQIYYVHNRVQTMERTASWIQELVPDAHVVMAHGQMDGRVLEGVMLQFFHGEADILVASSIIQSGLDVPRANTMLVDRADLFGLAQLYQLRGRVGRAGEQAYAYFFFPNEELLSTDAQKRLLAIQEFADLGSGFRIAAADLEIRGAGNILGKQQSGNIVAVGLDLYMQMVEQAVQHIKGQEVEEELDPELHLNVSAFVPDNYVEDGHQRLSLYKRLSASQKMGDLALLHEETQDRYGTLPEPVERLFEVMQIKLLAKQLRLESIEVKKGTITLTLDPKATLSQEGMDWLLNYRPNEVRFVSPRAIAITTGTDDWTLCAKELNSILQTLRHSSSQPTTP